MQANGGVSEREPGELRGPGRVAAGGQDAGGVCGGGGRRDGTEQPVYVGAAVVPGAAAGDRGYCSGRFGRGCWRRRTGANARTSMRRCWGSNYLRAATGADPRAVEAGLDLDRAARRLVQQGLTRAGFSPGSADGVFGPATRAAIRGWPDVAGDDGDRLPGPTRWPARWPPRSGQRPAPALPAPTPPRRWPTGIYAPLATNRLVVSTRRGRCTRSGGCRTGRSCRRRKSRTRGRSR